MNAEAQQIAIAETCGFKITRIEYDGDGKIYRVWAVTPDSWAGKDVRPWLPDFLNDLNAMHEAENVLTDMQWHEYESNLRQVCEACCYYEGAGRELLHATAAQRCEAFLKTIGKWEVQHDR